MIFWNKFWVGWVHTIVAKCFDPSGHTCARRNKSAEQCLWGATGAKLFFPEVWKIDFGKSSEEVSFDSELAGEY